MACNSSIINKNIYEPNLSTTVLNSLSTSDSFDISASTPITLSFIFLNFLTIESTLSLFLPLITNLDLKLFRVFANSNPIPFVEPVIIITLSFNCFLLSSYFPSLTELFFFFLN